MNDQKKIRILSISVIVLVIINLASLGMYWARGGNDYGKKKWIKKHRSERRDLLSSKLDFDEDQVQEYMQLRTAHEAKVEQLKRSMFATKREMMKVLLQEEVDSSQYESILQKSSDTHSQFEKNNIQYLLSVRELCNEEQRMTFDELIPEMIDKMDRGPRRKRRHHKN